MIIDIAKKIQGRILKNQSFFKIDIDIQKKILNSFKEPADLFERSYFQYSCQMKQLPLLLIIIQNLAALLLLPYYYLKYRNVKIIKGEEEKKVAVFISGNKDKSYIPRELEDEFEEIILSDYNGKCLIGVQEEKVILDLCKRYWYKPYFCLKSMMKIALYAYQIKKYNPVSILTFCEFSFTSSLLTYYCNQNNLSHINLMHGEKVFDIHDSFVQFNRYYVWDKHYAELLIRLRAEKDQFVIAVPSCVKLSTIINQKDFKYELTYYLGGESEKDLMKIRKNLLDTKIPTEKLCIRYHPRYSDELQIKGIFKEFQIEDPGETSLNISLSITKNVVSLYSTILFQAYESGKQIIIDDLTDLEKYLKLESLNYIMISKPHRRLSELVE